jgi:hypothetical protein
MGITFSSGGGHRPSGFRLLKTGPVISMRAYK